MDICILRKVPYRLPGTKRLVWAVVLAEHEGLSLLFVQKPDDKRSHVLTIATENVAERLFEEANANRFSLDHSAMAEIGKILQALGEGLSESEFHRFFRWEDDD